MGGCNIEPPHEVVVVEEKEIYSDSIIGGTMRQETYRSGLYITVGVPRALWRRVKYEALRRETAAKNLLVEALEAALARWEAEKDVKPQRRA